MWMGVYSAESSVTLPRYLYAAIDDNNPHVIDSGLVMLIVRDIGCSNRPREVCSTVMVIISRSRSSQASGYKVEVVLHY